MTQWIALSPQQHRHHGFLAADGDYPLAMGWPHVGILVAELGQLLPHYVLGFVRDGGVCRPVALLTLDGQRNLYLNSDGRWISSYVPAWVRALPFRVAEAAHGKQALCVASEALTEAGGTPLFDSKDQLTLAVKRRLAFLQRCQHLDSVTRDAAHALDEAGLIEPWPLQVKQTADDPGHVMEGLYRIRRDGLRQLSAEALETLCGDPLELAFAQQFSTYRISQLGERAKLIASAEQTTGAVGDNLDTVFDGSDDDDLIFDFDT